MSISLESVMLSSGNARGAPIQFGSGQASVGGLSSQLEKLTSAREALPLAAAEAEALLCRQLHCNYCPEDPAFSARGRIWANVYVNRETAPGVWVSPRPTDHGTLSLNYKDYLSERLRAMVVERLRHCPDWGKALQEQVAKLVISPVLNEALFDAYVSAWIVDDELQFSADGVQLKKPGPGLDKLLAAIQVGRACGFERIAFDGLPAKLSLLRHIGCLHLVDSYVIPQAKEARREIESHIENSPAGNTVYYVPATRKGMVTIRTLRELLAAVNDRDVFLPRLREIVEGRVGVDGRCHYELMIINRPREDGQGYALEERAKEIDPLFERLKAVYETAQQQRPERWGNSGATKVQRESQAFLDAYLARTAELFHREDLDDPQQQRVLCAIAKGVPSVKDLFRLSDELRGRHVVQAGGFLGWQDAEMAFHHGAESLGARTPLGLETMEKIVYCERPYYVLSAQPPYSPSLQVFYRAEGVWWRKQFVFDAESAPPVRSLLNWVLKSHPDVTGPYVSLIPESLAMPRDPDPESVLRYGYPLRRVYLVSTDLPDDAEEERKGTYIARMMEWPPAYLAHYGNKSLEHAERLANAIWKHIKLQRMAFALFGGDPPKPGEEFLPIAAEELGLPADTDDSRSQSVRFLMRPFIDGKALGRIDLLGEPNVSPEYMRDFARLLGTLAAINLVARRKFFKTVDEIVTGYDNKRNLQARFTHTTAAFAYERVMKPDPTWQPEADDMEPAPLVPRPLEEDASLYGLHLAEVLKCAELVHGKKAASACAAAFFAAFKIKLEALKKDVEKNETAWLAEVDDHYDFGEVLDPNYDFRKSWGPALKTLRETDVASVMAAIQKETVDAKKFYDLVLTGCGARDEQRAVLREAEFLFASTWNPRNGISHQLVMDVVAADPDFVQASAQTRLDRLSALHLSCWNAMVGIPNNHVLDFAEEAWRQSGADFNAARDYFISQINAHIRDVTHRPLGITPAVAMRVFDALYGEERAAASGASRRRQLEQLGYLFPAA